jgi:hypothetical protein
MPRTGRVPGKAPRKQLDEERATFEPRSISVVALAREGIAGSPPPSVRGLLPLFGLPDQIEP